jgi:hypothetical protein
MSKQEKCHVCGGSGIVVLMVCQGCGSSVEHCMASMVDCVGAGCVRNISEEERPCWRCDGREEAVSR